MSNEVSAPDGEIKSAKHENICDALAAAQGEFSEIKKEKTAKIRSKSTGAEYSYNYADLAAVIEATRGPLSRHGLSVSWVYVHDKPGYGTMLTQLLHHSGKLESAIPVFYDDKAQSVMQAMGSAQTYARRYGLSGLIGVVAEDDDDGAGAGTPPEQQRNEPRQQRSNGQQRQQAESKPKQEAKPATTNGEKKPLIEQIKDRIHAAVDPSALIAVLANSAKSWPDKKEFLESIFDLCGEENIARVANGFTYDNVGKLQVWDEDDRKWVFAELTKIMDGKSEQPANEPEAEPADWPTRIEAVTKSDELFNLISEMADDADLTTDLNAFNAVCDLITAKLDASVSEWGEGAVKISRQFLSNRITAVEMQHGTKEAMSNATAS